ncbi:MAG: dihydrodipicolinate synthase family protein, partial [Candidatus Aenigmarchaeota archaeon]|nr:dihydrodipicolinate synthase family protein [Candidatus Aenigmarchaeota archaeon]
GQLANEERIVGIKDSSGDFIFFEKLVQQTKHLENFAVLMGIDNLLLAGFAVGADGAVVWASNIVPELPLELYKAVR